MIDSQTVTLLFCTIQQLLKTDRQRTYMRNENLYKIATAKFSVHPLHKMFIRTLGEFSTNLGRVILDDIRVTCDLLLHEIAVIVNNGNAY